LTRHNWRHARFKAGFATAPGYMGMAVDKARQQPLALQVKFRGSGCRQFFLILTDSEDSAGTD